MTKQFIHSFIYSVFNEHLQVSKIVISVGWGTKTAFQKLRVELETSNSESKL